MLVALLTSTASTGIHADDIDVYKAGVANQQKPNVLFVLDYSGSMGWDTSGIPWSTNRGPSRISVLKLAIEQILDSNEGNINAGLGSLYSTSTTGIQWPISDLSALASSIDPTIAPSQITVKDIIKQKINERNAGGSTATVDALVEAAQYFRGDPVTHNDSPLIPSSRHRPATWNSTLNRYTGGNSSASTASSYSPSNAWTSDTSQTFYCNDYSISGGPNFCEQQIESNCVPKSASDTTTSGYELKNNLWGNYEQCEYSRSSSWETPRFNSPIADSCEGQANAIILITDGEPTVIKKGASLRSLVGDDLSVCEDLDATVFASSQQTDKEGNCAIEIVRNLATQTVNPYLPDSRVLTYTVGFNINGPGQQYLKQISEAGQGEFYNTQSAGELNAALTAAIDDIKSGGQSFSGLSVDVDKASFSHGNHAYYSLFTPSGRRTWNGNLKGYFVENSGLVDINGNAAIENNQFKDDAQSFWSAQPDGDKVKAGGASEQLVTGTRTLYTHVTGDIPVDGVELANGNETRLRSSNTVITNAMLGLNNSRANRNRRNTALDWLQNAPMGDPLHTRSVSVTYENKKVVYVMTNQGFLHAIDASKPVSTNPVDVTGGEEIFAFMPKRLLKNLPDLQVSSLGEDHIYGLDGPITRWHDDTNKDGVVNDTEKVMLYFGMRRGGNAYYAMDISDPDSPVLKWIIDENSEGFERLAQSWSRMSLIKVKDGDDEKRVLAFAGGYDAEAQDDVNEPVESKGNAIYMVDEDKNLLWTVDIDDDSNMKYSIASDLTIIDSDGDQFADRLYVGDLGGQIWRVDFGNISDTPIVTRLADLSDAYHQPFFYPPSVAINGNKGERFLSVTIGSGNRTDPLLTDVQNNFYMIRDTDVKKGAPSNEFSTVSVTDLYNATDNDIQSGVTSKADTAYSALKAARGWRVKLYDNEKSLSGVLTYEGKVMATTFRAATHSDDDSACSFEPTGKFYVMDVNDASILNPLDDDSTSEEDGPTTNENDPDSDNPQTRYRRGQVINTQGIPSSPVPVLTKGSNTVQVFVDKEPVDEFDRTLTRVYWHAR